MSLALEDRLARMTTAYEAAKARQALACQLADGLQDDLGRREASLGRAMALAHALWTLNGYGPDKAVRIAGSPEFVTWPGVVRWVADGNVLQRVVFTRRPMLDEEGESPTLRADLERVLSAHGVDRVYGPVVGPALNTLIELVVNQLPVARTEGGQDDRPGAAAQEPSAPDAAGDAAAARPAEPRPVRAPVCTCGAGRDAAGFCHRRHCPAFRPGLG